MVPCLHPTTAGHRLDLPDYLRLARDTGFPLVDWDVTDIHSRIERDGLDAVQRLFSENQVAWAGFGLPIDLFADDDGFEEALSRLPDLAQVAETFQATRSMTWLWPSVDVKPVPLILRLIHRCRQVADLLAPYHIRFGLEFVGPHHLRNKKYPLLYTLTDMIALIEAIDRPNVGVLLDSYHWYTSESSLEELQILPVSKVVEVHINDASLNPQEAHDQERCLPGEGQIDLLTFLRYLADGGYDGPLSLEILRRTPPEASPEIVAQKAYQGLSQLIAAAKA